MQELLIVLPVLIFSIVLHEVAHGWVARQQGDPTAAMLGRLTLNPKLYYYPSDQTTLSIGLSGMFEDREGGDVDVIENGVRRTLG